MRQWLCVLGVTFAALGSLFLTAVFSTGASWPRAQEALTVTITPWGPTQAMIDEVSSALPAHPVVQRYLSGTRSRQAKGISHRLLAFELIDGPDKTSELPAPPHRYRATIYDYTRNRALSVEGDFNNQASLEVSPSKSQPLPSREEFKAAVDVVRGDATFGPAIRDHKLKPYPPMPPLVGIADSRGQVERTVTVGLLPGAGEFPHEIVGVNLIQNTVVRFKGGAPPASLAAAVICATPGADEATTKRGAAGKHQVIISQGGTELWRFLAVRPAASSGRRGSGIEIQSVDYRGKRVLFRAHAPILNVKYDNNACGPFRDWQWEEGRFEANGTNVASGFRSVPTPARTILDSDSDAGNFRGVAIYTEGEEVVLVSELEAGWYRYISQWRFHPDGTIRPRFGFGAVQNSCVCNVHHHNVYWRFDFDLVTEENNAVFESSTQTPWTAQVSEIMRLRDPANSRRWMVQNTSTGAAYLLIPGAGDGTADTYARGDVWILRYQDGQIDDGRNSTTSRTEADLNRFVNGESVNGQDIVVWYAAHFDHTDDDSTHGHILGPDLVLSKW